MGCGGERLRRRETALVRFLWLLPSLRSDPPIKRIINKHRTPAPRGTGKEETGCSALIKIAFWRGKKKKGALKA